MLSFESDYTTGAHPKILQRLTETNLESVSGYGADRFCAEAKEQKVKIGCKQSGENKSKSKKSRA